MSTSTTYFEVGGVVAALQSATTLQEVVNVWNPVFDGDDYGVSLDIHTEAGSVSGISYSAVSESDLDDVVRTVVGMAKAMAHYPSGYIKGLPLTELHLTTAFGVGYVAFTVAPVIYVDVTTIDDITVTGIHVFHHELMHVAKYGDSGYWGDNGPTAWQQATPGGYLGQAGSDPNNTPAGFASNYGQTNFDEDLAEVATEVWEPGSTLFQRTATDTNLHTKVQLLLAWWSSHGFHSFDDLLDTPVTGDDPVFTFDLVSPGAFQATANQVVDGVTVLLHYPNYSTDFDITFSGGTGLYDRVDAGGQITLTAQKAGVSLIVSQSTTPLAQGLRFDLTWSLDGATQATARLDITYDNNSGGWPTGPGGTPVPLGGSVHFKSVQRDIFLYQART